jgi:hypothetical protein
MDVQTKIVLIFGMLLLPFSSFSKGDFFIKNYGQIIDKNGQKVEEVICFYRGKEFDVYFQKDKISYVIKKGTQHKRNNSILSDLKQGNTTQIYRVDQKFIDANFNGNVTFLKPETINYKYLNGAIGEIKIKSGYQEILYRNIYDGIDLRFYFYKGSLKYDFIVHANGNSNNIKMEYLGAESLINQPTKIIVKTPLGNLEESIPSIYQISDSKKKKIEGSYQIKDNQVSFRIEDFDSTKDLIIDPWATFVGGLDIEEGYSVFIDKKENTYISGYTGSANFPTTVGALETIKEGQYDAFLTKLDTTGNAIWSTFYGGSGDEFGYEVLVDSDDNPYLIGHTNGNDILVSSSGVFQTTSGGSYDSFILKLDSAGNFIWGTYFGGIGGEFTLTAAIDKSDNILLGGFTSSNDMPTINPYQGTMGGALDAFVAKFDTTGNLIWSTYCGGTNSEDVHVLKTDNQNNVIISGETFSSDFPVSSGAYQSNNNGGLDVFLTKYDSTGNRVFSTYFGGFNTEDANGIATDNLNNIYVAGYTQSNDFPMVGSNIYQNLKNTGRDGFVVKFTPIGQLIRSTFIGGSGDDVFTSAEIGASTSLNIGGYTASTDIPIIGLPYQPTNNGLIDGMYFHLDSTLTPNYSTYIGGSSSDYLLDLEVDVNDLITFGGFTSSPNFPVTPNVFQDTIAGQSDAFVFQADSTFDIITNLSNSFFVTNIIGVYPNPFFNSVNLTIEEYDAKSVYQLFIYNVEGKKIGNKYIHQKRDVIEFDKNLKAGFYFFELHKNEEVIDRIKMIKSKL